MNDPDQIQTLDTDLLRRLVSGVRRRLWLVAGVTVTGAGVSLAIASTLPPVFESSAKVLVESQQIPNELARSTVTASAAERLTIIEQRLMTRENLLDIARRVDLFDEDSELSPTDRVEHLREKTQIESISFNANPRYRGPSLVSAFTISYRASDPQTAARVANEFVTMVIAQNITARSERASETHAFFRSEVERLAADLRVAEAEIAAFKSSNRNLLPGTQKLRLAELARLRHRMERRERLIARLESGTADDLAGTGDVEVQPAALVPLDASDGTSQLALLRSQQEVLKQKIVSLRAATDQATVVEMDLGALQRRLDYLQDEYRGAVRKQAEAATGEKLEFSRRAERFEVIEQAAVPESTIEPRRMAISMAGVAGSLGLALVWAFILELKSRAVRTARDMERLLAARPIAVIPYIPARADRVNRLSRRISGLIVIAVVAVSVAVFAPIDRLSFLPTDAARQVAQQVAERLAGLPSLSEFTPWGGHE
ncbi:MAG: Wzz/FepE/Etk N-terminal domain-containing protein [Pseudomonadota bacterium]